MTVARMVQGFRANQNDEPTIRLFRRACKDQRCVLRLGGRI